MDSKKNKSIEETYQKKSQLEHVLHRPGMYIGDIDKVSARTLGSIGWKNDQENTYFQSWSL